MLTPDQIRLQLADAEESNNTGQAYDAQAATSILITLLEDVLPDLVAAAQGQPDPPFVSTWCPEHNEYHLGRPDGC